MLTGHNLPYGKVGDGGFKGPESDGRLVRL
jgi:hypothetical protein